MYRGDDLISDDKVLEFYNSPASEFLSTKKTGKEDYEISDEGYLVPR